MAGPDFSTLLRKPAGEAKKPPALPPAADYQGIIKGYELGDQNKNKTPYVRFQVGLVGWPDSISAEDRQQDGKAIDLSKRPMRRDFYLTDDALWRLDEFLRALGIDLTGRSYEETLPEATGKSVVVEVQQYINQQSGEIGNQIGALTAQS